MTPITVNPTSSVGPGGFDMPNIQDLMSKHGGGLPGMGGGFLGMSGGLMMWLPMLTPLAMMFMFRNGLNVNMHPPGGAPPTPGAFGALQKLLPSLGIAAGGLMAGHGIYQICESNDGNALGVAETGVGGAVFGASAVSILGNGIIGENIAASATGGLALPVAGVAAGTALVIDGYKRGNTVGVIESTAGGVLAGVGSAAVLGALIGSGGGPIGTAIGAGIGLVAGLGIGLLGKNKKESKEAKEIESLQSKIDPLIKEHNEPLTGDLARKKFVITDEVNAMPHDQKVAWYKGKIKELEDCLEKRKQQEQMQAQNQGGSTSPLGGLGAGLPPELQAMLSNLQNGTRGTGLGVGLNGSGFNPQQFQSMFSTSLGGTAFPGSGSTFNLEQMHQRIQDMLGNLNRGPGVSAGFPNFNFNMASAR